MRTVLAFPDFANQVIQIHYSWLPGSLIFRPVDRFLNEEGVVSVTGEFLNAYGGSAHQVDDFYSRLPPS